MITKLDSFELQEVDGVIVTSDHNMRKAIEKLNEVIDVVNNLPRVRISSGVPD